jgi:hypothetical protein
MSGRIRLTCAGLLAAATTAVMVAAPAVVQAGITFNCSTEEEPTCSRAHV